MTHDILTARHEAAHAVIAAVLDCKGDGFPSGAVIHSDGSGVVTAPIPSDERWLDMAAAGFIQDTMDGARSPEEAMAGARTDFAMLALGDDFTDSIREQVGRMAHAPHAMHATALPRLAERWNRVEGMLHRHQQYVYAVANWLVVEHELDDDQLRYVLGPIAGVELETPRRRRWRRDHALRAGREGRPRSPGFDDAGLPLVTPRSNCQPHHFPNNKRTPNDGMISFGISAEDAEATRVAGSVPLPEFGVTK